MSPRIYHVLENKAKSLYKALKLYMSIYHDHVTGHRTPDTHSSVYLNVNVATLGHFKISSAIYCKMLLNVRCC